jgi:hypothetical protein
MNLLSTFKFIVRKFSHCLLFLSSTHPLPNPKLSAPRTFFSKDTAISLAYRGILTTTSTYHEQSRNLLGCKVH